MKTKEITLLSVYIAMGSVLYFLETFLPLPSIIPGGRWGFSNLVLLIALPRFSLGNLLFIAIGKSTIGNILSGRLMTPGYVMGLGGAMVAVLVMWSLYRSKKDFGYLGISLVGAQANNFFQLLFAGVFIMGTFRVITVFPYFALVGSISAVINAIVAHRIRMKSGDIL
ncbi:MAG: Gx transporter family protein [Thermotogota bacterium]|nr:Gx transporter family protein [Thermotogota bacterium]